MRWRKQGDWYKSKMGEIIRISPGLWVATRHQKDKITSSLQQAKEYCEREYIIEMCFIAKGRNWK